MKILVLCLFSVVQSRKYDIEAESYKLYGEDLSALLLRFRKSPEYLSILQEKLSKDMKAQLTQRMNHIVNYYHELLIQKILEMMQIKEESRSRTFRRSVGSYFGGMTLRYRSHRLFLRQDYSKSRGHPLDQYIKKKQILSTEKVNNYKDLGFEYAGYAIHAMIKNMGPDETSGKSTMQPYGGDHKDHLLKVTTTTEHHEHSVSPTVMDVTTGEVEIKTVADSFRYGYRPKMIRT